jgi:predicted PurR-regulated permease PerM
LENNFVQPLIQRHTVQLNPLWIIIAVLIGAKLLGLIGVLVAIPVAGAIQVILQEVVSQQRVAASAETAPTAAAPPRGPAPG